MRSVSRLEFLIETGHDFERSIKMSGGEIKTPMCDEWRNRIRRKMIFLEEFGEWYNRHAIEEHDGDCTCGMNTRMFEKFLTAEYEFDFNELERERQALLDAQRVLNEEPDTAPRRF